MLHLNEKDSFPFVEDFSERHGRLCFQTPGGDKYYTLIKTPYDDFTVKLGLRKAARKNVSAAGDVIWLFNDALNNVIRKIQGRAKEYDKEHLGSNTVTFILPDGNITPLIELTVEEKPEKFHEVALKITSLGSTHVLFPLAATLDEAVDNLKEKIALREETEKAYSVANTTAIIAKSVLVKQYNANYFLAASDVNKEYAEKLFPHTPRTPNDDDNDNGTPPSGPAGS